jgi:hypothetical protein
MACTICGHKKRREIDRALLERRPLRRTASQFGTSTGALQRHRAHIHRDLVEAHQAASRVEQFARADSLLADVRNAEGRAERLLAGAEDLLERAREAEDLQTAIGAIRAAVAALSEARQLMTLRGELSGEFPNNEAPNVTLVRVLSVPRMPGVQTVPLQALPAPAADTTEAARSLPAAQVDAPVEPDTSDIPPRSRR